MVKLIGVDWEDREEEDEEGEHGRDRIGRWTV
jgi:hypothetical protein